MANRKESHRRNTEANEQQSRGGVENRRERRLGFGRVALVPLLLPRAAAALPG